ncbi:MAG TPA: radical SAM protein [Candidatus Polarisedimenticolia bacterium]|nr:radical SAM protein [Candidatus Polarisedimenticolia bacterium]
MPPAEARDSSTSGADPSAQFDRPYVVSWNLTYRCNLACEHCYLDAGPNPLVKTEEFSDRSELSTEDCFRVVDEIATFAPECLTILTGGEPLLRRDILPIVRRCAERGLWPVVGTNGVKVTANVARLLKEAGGRGVALSLDALDAERHDRFRAVRGAWQNTVTGAEVLRDEGLPFLVQTTVGRHNLGELEAIAAFACDRLQARVWNLYFLVPTGRGQFVSDISPAEYDEVLRALARMQRAYTGRMLVNAKCAPHFIRTAFEAERQRSAPEAERERSANEGAREEAHAGAGDPGTNAAASQAGGPSSIGSPFLKVYSGGAGGCPAGTHYFGIRPNGDVTPCPYLPQFAGNLRTARLADLWNDSPVFTRLRHREDLGGRCGACELKSLCGGCRARALGASGDVMAEDALCTHEPGSFKDAPLLRGPDVVYGAAGKPGIATAGNEAVPAGRTSAEVVWDEDARERMKRIPAFVRTMVMRTVEDSCRKEGKERVTLEALEAIRSRMPVPKVFRPS